MILYSCCSLRTQESIVVLHEVCLKWNPCASGQVCSLLTAESHADREIMRAAVAQDWRCLRYAAPELKADTYVAFPFLCYWHSVFSIIS